MMRAFAFLLVVFFAVAPAFAADKVELKNDQDRISYAVGMNIGYTLKGQEFNLELDKVLAGLSATFSGKDTQMSQSEMGMILNSLQQQLQEKALAEQAELAERNLKAGQDYLDAHSKQEGVTVLESGLQYKVLVKGDGVAPTEEDTVKVHYRGTLVDGTEFDSSYTRGEPAEFPVQGVIPGWIEILQLMHVGDKFQVAIPPALAYGEAGAGQIIEPNSVLLFELELLDIVK